jgi:MerR family transcriptional regulator, heat shock protein HspR
MSYRLVIPGSLDILKGLNSMPGPLDGNQFNDPGEVAKYTMSVAVMMTGIPAHRLRRFEQFGLIKPTRTNSNQRLYSDANISIIRDISVLEQQQINLHGIRTILTMKQSPSEFPRPNI